MEQVRFKSVFAVRRTEVNSLLNLSTKSPRDSGNNRFSKKDLFFKVLRGDFATYTEIQLKACDFITSRIYNIRIISAYYFTTLLN